MASKPGSHLKEKGTSPSPTSSTVRRSPKPPGSPDRRLPTSTALKPKPTPSTNAATATAKSTTLAAVKRQPVTKKPAEKPPSPSRRPERTLSTPTTNRERSSPKPPPSTAHSPLTRPRTGNLPPSDHKGPKNVAKSSTGTGKPAGATFTRSKSLEKRKEVVAIPTAFVETTSSLSDTEALAVKAVPDLVLGAKEEHEEAAPAVQDHNPEQVESPVLTNNAEREEEMQLETVVMENEVGTKEVEEKPKEIKQEEVEAPPMQVDESPKERGAEPAEEAVKPEIKAVEAKEAPPAPRTMVGTKKEVLQKSNDVIEEAKSKFLEKRKNKVLALVGAFETVMALQEAEGGLQGQQQQQQQLKGGIGSSPAPESPVPCQPLDQVSTPVDPLLESEEGCSMTNESAESTAQ